MTVPKHSAGYGHAALNDADTATVVVSVSPVSLYRYSPLLSDGYGDGSLACRTLIGIHVADLTQHFVVTDRQAQACSTLQAVETFTG